DRLAEALRQRLLEDARKGVAGARGRGRDDDADGLGRVRALRVCEARGESEHRRENGGTKIGVCPRFHVHVHVSGGMFASRTTRVQRAVSFFTCSTNSSGVEVFGSMPESNM